MAESSQDVTPTVDLGLALSLSSDAVTLGIERWIAPVIDGHFDSVWSLENPLSDQAEPLVWLSAAATLAPTARVGTAAMIAPIRHPLLLARQLATLDRIAAGRLSVGVTIGRRARDYEVVGADFKRRGRMLDESIVALRSIWSGESSSAKEPVGIRPTTTAGPEILVGGHANVALKRAVRLGDGYLAGATSGVAHAIATQSRIAELLERDERDSSGFRFVANLFVLLARSRDEAIAKATETFSARHGGPPPYDPAVVVAGGPADQIAHSVFELIEAGYQGVNLVPLMMNLEQCEAAATVADLVKI